MTVAFGSYERITSCVDTMYASSVVSAAMEERSVQRWDRLGGACGVAYVVLIAAGWVFWAAPGIVEYNATAPVVARWFHDHQLMSQIGAVLGTLALFPFVFFLGALNARLRRAEGDHAAASAAAFAAGVIVGAMHFVFSYGETRTRIGDTTIFRA